MISLSDRKIKRTIRTFLTIIITITVMFSNLYVVPVKANSPDSATKQWMAVGTKGFSEINATYTSIVIDKSGTPYVVYKDGGNANKVTVKKYTGTSWETVGTAGFSSGEAGYPSIAIDSNGTPYVAYQDGGNAKKTTVKKYTGTRWETVGTAGFSVGEAQYISMVIDGNGTPFVVYQDSGILWKAIVKKYTGTSWATVGTAGFSAGSAKFTSIALDSSGKPYVVYEDCTIYKAVVKKYTGTSWTTVGAAGFSNTDVQDTSIAINGSGVPYVLYRESDRGNKATVKKYNGTSWETVGTEGFSDGAAGSPTIFIDSNETIYVAYTDAANSYKATVKKYTGTSWETVGTGGFSDWYAAYTKIAIDSNGTPYVIYQDASSSAKATVMKFGVATDTTAPTFDVTPVYTNVSSTSLDFSASINEGGTIYYMAVPDGSTAPTSAQVKAQASYGGVSIIACGSEAASVDPYTATFSITGLIEGTSYDIYVVAEDDEAVPNLMSDPVKFDVLTTTKITSFDTIPDVAAGKAGSTSYADAAAVAAALPTSVKANNNTVTVPVSTWQDTDSYNPNQAGSYTFTAVLGTLPTGYVNPDNYTATVEVVVGSDGYTVRYDANGGNGTAPIDSNFYYKGDNVSLASGSSLIKEHYRFTGWSQTATGAAVTGAAITVENSNIVLYAVWNENAKYKVTYHVNGGSGTVPVDGNQYYEGDTVNLVNTVSGGAIAVTGAAITLDHYSLGGWSTTPNGGAIGSTYTMGNSDITFYAVWVEDGKYTVTYDANGGGGIAPTDSRQYYVGETAAILDGRGLTKAYYSFGGWSLTPDGSALSTNTYTMGNTNVIFYAVWNYVAPTPVVNPDTNNGVGNSTEKKTTENITVDVKKGSSNNTALQLVIVRTTDETGKKSDAVTYEKEKAAETVEQLKKSGEDTARIVVTDEADEVSSTTITIPNASIDTLAKGNIGLTIETEEAIIDIPTESLKNTADNGKDLYFNLVPIIENDQQEEVEDRIIKEASSIEEYAQSSVTAVGVPMTIETNMSSIPADIILPLTGIEIPTDEAEKEAFLNQLAIFIEHSDGEIELVKGEIVEYKDGLLGIKFHITKFSTFTIVQTNAFEEKAEIEKSSSCKITKVVVPIKSTISGRTIKSEVSNKNSTLVIKVKVSTNATWELYSDKSCTKLLKKNKTKLKVGTNKVYIKVTAEDGSTKIYTLIIKRRKA